MRRTANAPVPLLALAFSSGAAALALELLWARQLSLAFGSSHYAVTTTLAGFMLGLGLGSLVGGRIADYARNPAIWLAGIELGLAGLGPLLTFILIRFPVVAAEFLPAISITEPAANMARFILAMIVMLPATFLMGATFPLMARSIRGAPSDLHRALPTLYGINTLGALAGVIGGSFWLLPKTGVIGVTAAAAAANACAAMLGLLLARISHHLPSVAGDAPCPAANPKNRPNPVAPSDWVAPNSFLYLTLAGLSGAAVLAGETLWNRILGIVLPNSTFTFALLLALYLGGLAIGSLCVSTLTRRPSQLRLWVLVQTAVMGWLLVSLALLPRISLWVRDVRPPAGWGRVLLTPLTVGGSLILPATLLLGAAWPILLAAGTPRIEDGGRRIGLMGMANAIGAAIGGAVAGWLIVPLLGISRSLLALAAIHALLGAMAALGTQRRILGGVAVILAVLAVAAPPFGQIALPSTASGPTAWQTVLYREAATGTITVLEDPSTGRRSMFVDNSAVIGTTYDALKVVRMLGILPVLLHQTPSDVLVIGYGAGVTTATLAASPAVRSIDVREIIPAVAEASFLFEAVNHGVLQSDKVRLGYGDGRNFLLTADRKWDVITCDPVHPLFGSAALYSLEFFELCRRSLQPGGQMYQYLPLHQMPPTAFRQAIATFSAVFPHTRIAFSLGHGVLIGSDQPIKMNWNLWQERLRTFEETADLVDSVLQTPAQIAALMQLDTQGCQTVGLSPLSTDSAPVLEFLEPAAFAPGVWKANAQTLIEAYDSPLSDIKGLPEVLVPDLQRLIAGKRLLLFCQLERNDGHFDDAAAWLAKALAVVPEDPEIRRYALQAQADGWFLPR